MWSSRSWWRYKRLLRNQVPNRIDPSANTDLKTSRNVAPDAATSFVIAIETISSDQTIKGKAQTETVTSQ
ncbi:MAG: hypothetical protein EBV34_19375 [Betaproteobacteria bacterium]|nr:hypothetical protein [Betaproteobacteria bacterium]